MSTRITILPFHSEDEQFVYLTESLHDLLVKELHKAEDYLLVAGESSKSIRSNQFNLDALAEKISVKRFIIGSLRHDKKIQVDLEYHNQESERIKRTSVKVKKENLFSLERECIRALHELLGITSLELRLEFSKLSNPKNYRKFLLGNFQFNRWTQESVQEAIELYSQVIEAEPDFVPAYLKLANCYTFLAGRGIINPSQAYSIASKSIAKALELQPKSGEAIIYKNLVDFFFELDWTEIYNSIELGLQQYVDASEAYKQLSFFWYGLKEYDASLDALYSALEYDPLSTEILNMIGDVQLSARRYDEAEKTFQSILKLIPNNVPTLENLMYISTLKNKKEKAYGYLRKINRLVNPLQARLPRVGFLYARFKDYEKVDEYLTFYTSLNHQNEGVYDNYLANVYAGLRDWENALKVISKAWKSRTGILYILTDPQLEPIRRHKDFLNLLKEVQFPELKDSTQYITLYTDIKETFRINLNTLLFVKAEDNYTRLFFYQNFRIEEKLVRATLKKIESQLPTNRFVRIHKSYLLNLRHKFYLFGNSRSRFVHLAQHEFELPISRSIAKDVLTKLEALSQ